jgi:Flp pilus assembly protein TadG
MISVKVQRGVAAVEFALVLIPMLLMVFGITEFGRAIYYYNSLARATRDATRYLTTQTPGSGYAAATCLAVYGQTTCGGSPLVPGLVAGQVTICDALNCTATHSAQQTGSGVINMVTVTIQGFQFVSLANFQVFGLTIGAPNMTFGPISTTMRQAL